MTWLAAAAQSRWLPKTLFCFALSCRVGTAHRYCLSGTFRLVGIAHPTRLRQQEFPFQPIQLGLVFALCIFVHYTQRLGYKTADNLDAYDSYLREVEYFWRLTQEANAQARHMFEKAVALDPQYSEAYVRLGVTCYLDRIWRWSADLQSLERALTLAQQALALDDSLPFAHSLLGFVYVQKHQHDQAIAESEPSPWTLTMQTTMLGRWKC